MNRYQKLAANTVLLSAGTFGSKVLVFLMVRFYTGYLSPADYGTADLLTQTANLLIPLFSLGITDGVFRFAIDREGARPAVFTIGFCVVSAGCALLAVLTPALGSVPALSGYGWLLAVFVAASCYHALCAQFVRAQGDTTLFAVQGLINTALVIGLNILFLAGLRLGIIGYVLSTAVADLLTTALLIVKKRLWRELQFHLPDGLLRQMLRYSLPLIPTSVFWWITSVSDRYMVSGFLGSDANGLYSVAYKIPTVLTILSSVFLEAWQLSAVTESNGNRRAHIRFYSKVWSVFQAAMLLCGSGVIALSQLAIRLLAAENYYPAWRYIPTLALAMVFAAFSSFLGSVYVVTKKSALSFRTALLGAGINLALNFCLIPSPLGAQGAAIATLVSYLIVFLVRAVSARRYIPFRLYPVELSVGVAILGVQTVFLLLELPGWQLVQAAAILLIFLLGCRPLLAGAETLGLPLPNLLSNLHPAIHKGGTTHDSNRF